MNIKKIFSSHPLILFVLGLLAIYLVVIMVPTSSADSYRAKSEELLEKARQADCALTGKFYYKCVATFGDKKPEHCDQWREQSALYMDYYNAEPELDCIDDTGYYDQDFLVEEGDLL